MPSRLCLPELSICALCLLRYYGLRPSATVFYDTLPRYVRAVCRLASLGQNRVAAVLGWLLRIRIERLPAAERVPDYPAIHLRAFQSVAQISGKLLADLERDPLVQLLGKLIGPESALAYAVKDLAHHEIRPFVLSLLLTASGAPDHEPILAILPPAWSPRLQNIIHGALPKVNFRFFTWPRWYAAVLWAATRALLPLRLLALLLARIVCRGISFREVERKPYLFMTEFVDPTRLRGTSYDADGWLAGTGIDTQDVLFFLTARQEAHLRRHGHNTAEILRPIEEKSYHCARLARLPYGAHSVAGYGRLCLRLLCPRGPRGISGPTAGTLLRACELYLEFAALFDRFLAKSILYLSKPNGDTAWRTDTAIVTGLARSNSVRSVGCQTRMLYARHYEFCFECYDQVFIWGPAWYDQFGEGSQFTGKRIDVGCLYLDTLLPEVVAAQAWAGGKRTVAIFPADLAGCHYTVSYGLSFLVNCARLALRYPDITFQVKCKDPENALVYLADEAFRGLCSRAAANFAFVTLKRYEYSAFLASSDVVLAMGFTTPGIEGLLLGKATIYYSELDEGETAISGVPGLIAHSEEDFNRLFDQAIARDGLTHDQRVALDALDPFRDGQARARVARHLLSSQAPGNVPEPVDAAVDAREIHQGAGAS